MSSDVTLPVADLVEHSARQRRAVGVGLLIATSVLWSLSGVAVKLADMHPVAFAMYRCLTASLVPLAMLPFSRGRWPDWRWMLLGVALYAAVVTLLITAMTLDTAARGILLQYTGPVFCALLAWLLQRRRIGRRTLLAMGVALAGVGIMLAGAWDEGRSLFGPISGALSGLAFGAMILVLEKIDRVAGGEVNPFAVVLFNNAGTVLILLPVAASLGVLGATPGQYLIVGLTGIIQLGIPYVLFQLALRRVHPVEASLLILLEPVLNPVWVAMATYERPDLPTIIGGVAILVGMVLEATKPPAAAMTSTADERAE